ncbi:hypothetical protein NA56DRAFT_723350 [Hyaloscypha hepaticicola]|uniref:Uncharacterized protein n=1 Tax=Hyaloscypha hepaticicola TaxID=2082293 RepID=A0A2J6Q1E8_9HELO|nr:hypothetical protein NA56DRAFT_723350 [Hyaloscypha hepaticicola]
MRHANLVATLLRYGADPNLSHHGWTVLTSTLRSRHENDGRYNENYAPIVRLLLEAGANPNPSLVSKSPLQLAVERDHGIDVVNMLLTAGADVNAVGSQEAVIFDMESADQERSARGDRRNIESYYDTPLMIAEKMINNFEKFTVWDKKKFERFMELQRLLVQDGGVAHSRLR